MLSTADQTDQTNNPDLDDERRLLLRHITAVREDPRSTPEYLAQLREQYRLMIADAVALAGGGR